MCSCVSVFVYVCVYVYMFVCVSYVQMRCARICLFNLVYVTALQMVLSTYYMLCVTVYALYHSVYSSYNYCLLNDCQQKIDYLPNKYERRSYVIKLDQTMWHSVYTAVSWLLLLTHTRARTHVRMHTHRKSLTAH